MSRRMDRRHYADIYGPTTGDRVTLVALAGKRTVYGFRQDVMGKL